MLIHLSVRFSFLLLLLNTFFLTSCTFSSDDEFFKEIPKPNPSSVNILINKVNLADYNQKDTIFLFGTTNFNFSLTGDHGEIEMIDVFLGSDGTSWQQVAKGFGQGFSIERSKLNNGVFLLKLELLMKSGTGSLIDNLGAEKFKVIKQWVIRVDVSPPGKPQASLDVGEGFLTLRWPVYSKPNFQAYIVKRTTPNGASQTFQIIDSLKNSWRDEGYVGGYNQSVKYSVSVISEVGTTESEKISRIDPLVVSFTFNNSDTTVTLHWKPTKFYGAFKDYRFDSDDGQELFITNYNDSTLTYKLKSIRFGKDFGLWFSVRSKTPVVPDFEKYEKCKLGTPLTFIPNGRIKFNFYLNTLVAFEGKDMLKLNDQLEPIIKIPTLKGSGGSFPYPGNYVYSYGGSKIYQLNLETQSEIAFDYVYLWNRNSSHSFASNGLICIDYYRPPVTSNNVPQLYVISVEDPVSNNIFYNESSNTTNLSAKISEDGKFIWVNEKSVFRITHSGSELIGSLEGKGTYIDFRDDNSDEIMFLNGDRIDFYDTNTLSFKRSIFPPKANYQFTYYEPQSKRMLWTTNSYSPKVYTVHIETGLTEEITVSQSIPAQSELYFVKNYLIYKGYFIKF